jgi:hypothetical protein
MKIRQIILILSFLQIYYTTNGQKIEKVLVSNQDPFNLYYSEDADSTTLFYLKIVPKVKPIGVLVILPAGGEILENTIKQISLHKLAIEKGLIVIFPSINWGPIKFDQDFKFLDIVFKQIAEQYKVPKDKFVLGGLSGAGMISLSYAEKAYKNKDSTFIIPKAIFALDAPVDFANLYYAAERDVARNFAKPAIDEGKEFVADCKKEFGGSPKDVPSEYIKYSIYSRSEPDGGNAKYLINTPILIYTEPGIEWQLENRHRDIYDLNCLDISAMVNFLQTHGNKNVKLIVTHNKGVRLDGKKHPHSWSIMDNQECFNWIMKQLN